MIAFTRHCWLRLRFHRYAYFKFRASAQSAYQRCTRCGRMKFASLVLPSMPGYPHLLSDEQLTWRLPGDDIVDTDLREITRVAKFQR